MPYTQEERRRRIGRAVDYIADDEFLDDLSEGVQGALSPVTGAAPPSTDDEVDPEGVEETPPEDDRARRVRRAAEYIADDEFLDDLSEGVQGALSPVTGVTPPPSTDDEPDRDGVSALLGEAPASAPTASAPVTHPTPPVTRPRGTDSARALGKPVQNASTSPVPPAAPEDDEELGADVSTARRELGDPTERSAPAGPAPAGPGGPPGDDPYAAVDGRIDELRRMFRNSRSAAERRVIQNLITNLIGTASRYIAQRYGVSSDADSYTRGLGQPSQDERTIQNLIAETGQAWQAEDHLRDATRIEAERLRQRDEGLRQRDDAAELEREQLAQRGRMDEARMGELGARADRTRSRQAREEAELDWQSEISRQARDGFRMSSATLPEDVQAAFADRLNSLDQLSAREIHQLSDDIQRFAQGRLAQRTSGPRRPGAAGGAGGTAAAPDAVIAGAEARVRRLVEANRIDQATGDRILEGFRAPGRRTRQEVERQLDQIEGGLSNSAQEPAATRSVDMVDEEGNGLGEEILPGVRTSMSSVREVEARQIRQAFDGFRNAMGDLQSIHDIVREAGGVRALVDPGVRRRISTRLVPLRNMVTEIQGTGIIQMGERHLIDAELPDPSSAGQAALGTWYQGLLEWQRINMQRAVTAGENRGILGADRDRLVELLRAPAGRATRAGRSGRAGAPARRGGEQTTIRGTGERGSVTIDLNRLRERYPNITAEQARAAYERQNGPVEWE